MATFIVDQNGDDAAAEAAGTTLREALEQADASSGPDRIEFDETVFTGGANNIITLTQGELVLESDVTIDGDIDGNGTADITISGDATGDDATRLDAAGNTITDVATNANTSDNSRVIRVDDRTEATLNGLVITGGDASGFIEGAGILIERDAELTITNSSISGNSGSEGGGIANRGTLTITSSDVSFNEATSGGGIRNRGELEITSSTITNNSARDGGGLLNSGTNGNEGFASLVNVTVADNTATSTGGGIQAYEFDFTQEDVGTIELRNVTITGNSAGGDGGGLYIRESTVFAYNSIILGNGAPTDPDVGLAGTIPVFFDGGGNILTGDPSDVFDQTQTNAGSDGTLGTADDAIGGVLADNGGAVQSAALLDNDANPALDIGGGVVTGTDADGNPRSIDRAGVDNGGVVDAGAVELQTGTPSTPVEPQSFVVNTNAGVDPFDGRTSLEEAIAFANADPDTNTITFDPTVFTGGAANTIRVSQTLNITTNVIIDGDIDGDGTADIVLSGDRAGDDVTTVTRHGVTITDVFNSPEFTRLSATDNRLKDNVQILNVEQDADVTLNGLVLTGGADLDEFNGVSFGTGGAGYVSGTLTVTNSSISGNTANNSGGAFYVKGGLYISDSTVSDNLAPGGGAIQVEGGTLVTERVTFADNVADSESGTGTVRGGAINNDGNTTLINTTLVANSARGSFGEGGAVYHRGPSTSFDSQSLDLLNVTITGNASSNEGGGVYLDGGNVTIANSIILGNDALSGSEIGYSFGTGPAVDLGGNLFGGDATEVFDATETTAGADGIAGNADDGLAGVLANNGGQVQTVALNNSDTNPALDVGTAFSLDADDSDALLNARAVDRAGVDNGGIIDAGAVEVQQGTVVPVGPTPGLVVNSADDGNLLDGLTSISEAIAFANSNPDTNKITFDPSVFTGGSANIIFVAETLEITTNVTIDGDIDNDGTPDIVLSGDVLGDDATTTDANGTTITDIDTNTNTTDNARVVRVSDGAEVAFDGLTITGGVADGSGGGILLFVDSSLDIQNSSISGNLTTTNGSGAGIFSTINTTLTITDTLISQNYSGTFGGGIYSSSQSTLSGLTITGNSARTAGGGVYVNNGYTSLTNSTISDNESFLGGGLQISGDFVGTGLAIYDNAATTGAGINVGRALSSGTINGNALVQNSTIADNDAVSSSGTGVGGGVAGSGGVIQLVNTTITGNAAGSIGGGISVNRARVELQNSIVLGNSAPTDDDLEDGVVDNLGNIVGGDAALVFDQTAINAGPDGAVGTADDVLAGALADNGGPVQTVALRNADDNPAIDTGVFTISQETTDVFGNPRFIDRQTGPGTGIIDAGAVEVQDGVEVTLETPGFVVNTQGDSNSFDGLTSLREAVALANSNPDENTITFDPTVFTGGTTNVINLTFGEIDIASALTIEGDLDGDDRPDIVVSADANGDDVTTVGPNGSIVTDQANNPNIADNSGQVFLFSEGADAVINGIIATGGNATFGGGIAFADGSQGTFQNGAIIGNRAVFGGGINNQSDAAQLINVQISDNFVTGSGAGIRNEAGARLTGINVTISDNISDRAGAGIFNDGALTLINATIVGNAAVGRFGDAGAIFNSGPLDLVNATITGNTAAGNVGGVSGFEPGENVRIQNTIIAGNADDNGNVQIDADFTDLGGNVLNVGADQVFADTVVLPGADGVLNTADDVIAGQAADNGGLIETVALRDDDSNPALDISDTFPGSQTATDASGSDRGVDRLGVDNGGRIDAGALELQTGTSVLFSDTPSLVVNTLSDAVNPFDGLTSLREALILANSDPDESEITFDDTVFVPGQDNVIRLVDGTLVFATDLSIDGDVNGDGLPDVTVTGDALGDDITTTDNVGATVTDAFNNTNTADNTRVISIDRGVDASINGLTITGGVTTDTNSYGNGAGIRAEYSSSLFLSNSSISGNVAGNEGGGLSNNGVATALNVAVTGNTAYRSGGGITTFGANGSDDNGAFFGVNLTISGNYAGQSGGGISSGEGGILLASTIVGNTTGGDGAGAEADFRDPFTLISTTVSGNLAGDQGGGIFSQTDAELSLQNSIVIGNGAATGEQIERFSAAGTQAFTDNGGNLITGDSTQVFANTVALDGFDGVPGTADDTVGAVLDQTGTLFQSVSLNDDAGNPALALVQTPVVVDETQFRLDFNGDGDADDTAITLAFDTAGASGPDIIAALVDDTPPPPSDDDTFIFNDLGDIDGGIGTDTVDFSGLAADELPGAFDGVVVDLDLNSAGDTGTPSETGSILDDLPSDGGTPIADGGLTDIENVIGSNFDDGLFGNNEVNVLIGGNGNDTLAGFSGNDTLTGGNGADEFRGTPNDLNGDTITDFGFEDQLRILGQTLDISNITFNPSSGAAAFFTSGSNSPDVSLSFGGAFDATTLFPRIAGGDTLISLAPVFSQTFDLMPGRALQAFEINGLFDQILLNGGPTRQFEIEISDIGIAGFQNALGVYEVTETGDIVDTRILTADANADVGTTFIVDDVEVNHTLGFFIVQDGSDFVNGLGATAELSFVNETGGPANVEDGPALLAVDGAVTDEFVFHSFDPSLNEDGEEHVISGVNLDGSLTIGFEDLVGLGDSDFEDVVFKVTINDDFGF
ncbi:MAG: choice-of-anchor Q domain-containing protein [Pseudomonadota bacterium]